VLLLLELSLRVSEAVGTDIDGRHRVLRLKGKGQSAKAAARRGASLRDIRDAARTPIRARPAGTTKSATASTATPRTASSALWNADRRYGQLLTGAGFRGAPFQTRSSDH
jgi:hypothetical protein